LTIDIKKYKHFSFDLWLTLIQSNPEFKKKRNLLFKEFFEIDQQIEKVSDIIRHYDIFCNKMNEKTGLNIDTFEIYYLILNSLGKTIEAIDLKRLHYFYVESELLFLNYKPTLIVPEIKRILKEITEQDKTINILSNTAFIKGTTLRKIIEHYELSDYFLFQLYSDETGFSKPNYKMFEMLYQKIENKNISKSEILHLGDNKIADFDGAINFGFNAQLV
jgi:putative hydrolase of the HAD superfamily